ncbi:MAG TPA: alpha/beta hydrolase [Leptolyngbyaceae cyanobacterium M33_DOE_097]|uniref:Alpha/beta hydrolase n=1 Tax=Oscillatoriales cyanobacterium SpSt-418 TaxID=2282169 RepID=A0A7C3PIM1_9CYAN|nr:alpha/beta hydrolase [Leptolyngbyaceae cyanobacterium M33_DOE_097]
MQLPTVILPGYLAGASEYQVMQQTLQSLNHPAVVVPLRWWEWVPTVGGRSVTPILRRLDETVQQVKREFGVDKINLVGHSAGGWLARIYLGEKAYCVHPQDNSDCCWFAKSSVATLVTLGTPHMSQERWTLKNLNFVNDTYPGAFYNSDVQYICVAGKAIFGDRFRSWLAFSSYKLTVGEGACWGDGITPITAAHLIGAENLTLDGVNHSPKGGIWYGSPEVVAVWATYLV